MRRGAAVIAVAGAMLIALQASAGAGAGGVRPALGHWYGAAGPDRGHAWIAFRVADRDGQRYVTDVTASSEHPGCTIRVDADGRPRLRALRVDRRGRFADAARDEVVAGGTFSRARRVRGTIRLAAAAARKRGCPTPAPAMRFAAKPTARRLPQGHWSGTLDAQRSSDGSQVAAQALGFDVLRGGRFMRTGALRLRFLVACPAGGPVTKTAGETTLVRFVSATPFGAVGGRRAIPPRPSFTLVAEPFAEGVALRWRIAVDGDRATGWVHAERVAPASSCGSERIAWTARRR